MAAGFGSLAVSSGKGHLLIPASQVITTASGVSYAFWVKCLDRTVAREVFKTTGDPSNGGGTYRAGIYTASIRPDATNYGMQVTIPTTSSAHTTFEFDGCYPDDSNWHHVVISWNPSTSLRLWIDNSEKTLTSGVPNFAGAGSSGRAVQLGGWAYPGTTGLDGALAHFAIWRNWSISATDVARLYHGESPLTVTPASLAVYAPLHEPPDGVLVTRDTNAHSAVVTGNIATWSTTTVSTTHSITLPSGMTVGNTVFCMFRGSGGGTITTPAGWSQVHGNTSAGPSYCWRRTVDGTEGASLAITVSVATAGAGIAWEIDAAVGSFAAVTATTFTHAAITSTIPTTRPRKNLAWVMYQQCPATQATPSAGWTVLARAETTPGSTSTSDVSAVLAISDATTVKETTDAADMPTWTVGATTNPRSYSAAWSDRDPTNITTYKGAHCWDVGTVDGPRAKGRRRSARILTFPSPVGGGPTYVDLAGTDDSVSAGASAAVDLDVGLAGTDASVSAATGETAGVTDLAGTDASASSASGAVALDVGLAGTDASASASVAEISTGKILGKVSAVDVAASAAVRVRVVSAAGRVRARQITIQGDA